MEKLVLHPTDTSQWHQLVNDAQASCATELGEELESYLVFMLMRYTSQPELTNSVLSLDYLEGHQAIGQQRQIILRDVGDKCLLYSGLFPGRAERRQVNVSYFVDLGQTAYHSLSVIAAEQLASLFEDLSHDFVSLMDVLLAIRALAKNSPQQLQPLQAMDLWSETGSEQALEALKSYTDAMPILLSKQSSD